MITGLTEINDTISIKCSFFHLFIHIFSEKNDTPDGMIHRSAELILHIHLGQKTEGKFGGRRALILRVKVYRNETNSCL